MKHFLSIFILFLLIVSCDPCDDCDSVSFEPTVSLIFINQDSIKNINDSLAVFVFNDSALSANTDSLTILRDSLEIVKDSIANGGSLSEEQMNLEQWISERQIDSTFYADLDQNADSLTSIFNQTKATINSGLIQLGKIEILGTGTVFTYEDSAEVWSIPLSYDAEFKQYEIQIAGITDILEVDYETFQEVDEERNVLIRAKNIEVISFTNNVIDSVLTNCDETCQDGEATFTIYF
ncbi:hypothetical protein [Ekhidna sp.]|uniref:hypothetical protein n=1 Tax=Ekhidna sp. TaxID=2608089 RepID=UPI003C7AE23F